MFSFFAVKDVLINLVVNNFLIHIYYEMFFSFFLFFLPLSHKLALVLQHQTHLRF